MEDVGVYGTPAWFDGGKKIAYLQWPHAINTVSIITRHCFDLDGKANFFSSPVFTPDGKEIISSNDNKGNGRQRLLRFTLSNSVVTPLESVESQVTSFTWGYVSGDMKPVLSRSGRYLAYLRTTEPSTEELRVRDLKTGTDRRLMSLPDLRRVWSFPRGDGYPGYAITPDEKDIIIWSRGKLFRILLTGSDSDPKLIPFTVEVKKRVSAHLSAHYHISDDSLNVKSIRWPLVTADGKELIFSAIGSLWQMYLPNGSPVKMTNSDHLEIMPALSPNGKELAYVSSDRNGGAQAQRRLMIYNMETGKTLTVFPPEDSASYLLPSWSPDGFRVAVIRQKHPKKSEELEYGWLDLTSKQFHRVASYPFATVQEYVEPMHIVFAQNGQELLYVDRDKKDRYKLILRSVSLTGNNSRDLLTTADPSVTAIYPCSDKKKAFVLGWDYEGYLTELTPANNFVKEVSTFDPEKKKNLTLISKGGALYPRWSGDNTLIYGWLKSIYQYQVADKNSRPIASVKLTIVRRGNQGTYALQNARVITMSGHFGAGKVFENATILVRDRRIIAVGPVVSTAIPPEAVVIDATGMTIMPGLIDGHGHEIGANLFKPVGSYGIRNGMTFGFTTILDAATFLNDDTGLSDIELIEAGKIEGARCFSTTGMVPSMYYWVPKSGVKYRRYEEVQNQVRRRVELGAEQCLKQKLCDNYRQFSQWMAKAAREAGVSAIAHIQLSHEQALSRSADGYSIDHPGFLTPSYRDVIQFMSRTGSIWTVHHTMTSGQTSRSNYSDVDLEYASMFQRLGDRKEVEFRRSGGQGFYRVPVEEIAPLETSWNAGMARLATQIADAGGKIAGASMDGEESFTNHFELWEFRRQGMPPGDVLRTATMIPAEKLGIQGDVGSIEPGKLADLLILNGNPLERIESTLDIKYTILAGMIYDPETLKVIPPKQLALKK
jgi:hypothetical protein